MTKDDGMKKIENIINKNKDTEFYKIISSIWDDKVFVSYCCVSMDTEEKRQKLLKYIKDYHIDDSVDVTRAVLNIDAGREPEEKFNI